MYVVQYLDCFQNEGSASQRNYLRPRGAFSWERLTDLVEGSHRSHKLEYSALRTSADFFAAAMYLNLFLLALYLLKGEKNIAI